jgi:hypothetical protein
MVDFFQKEKVVVVWVVLFGSGSVRKKQFPFFGVIKIQNEQSNFFHLIFVHVVQETTGTSAKLDPSFQQ